MIMRVFGGLLFIVGILWVVVAITLDTTAGSSYNNLGLLFSQFENVVIGCFIMLCGTVLFCAAHCALCLFDVIEERDKA